jgi:hypothetical protein
MYSIGKVKYSAGKNKPGICQAGVQHVHANRNERRSQDEKLGFNVVVEVAITHAFGNIFYNNNLRS